jgi:hypothetical protein
VARRFREECSFKLTASAKKPAVPPNEGTPNDGSPNEGAQMKGAQMNNPIKKLNPMKTKSVVALAAA